MRPSTFTKAALSLGGVALVAAQDGVCPNGLTVFQVQPAQIVAQQPVWIEGYFPHDCEVPIRDGLTVTITGAPTSICTQVTYTQAYWTTFTRTLHGNRPDDGASAITVTGGYSGTQTVTTTLPPVLAAAPSQLPGPGDEHGDGHAPGATGTGTVIVLTPTTAISTAPTTGRVVEETTTTTTTNTDGGATTPEPSSSAQTTPAAAITSPAETPTEATTTTVVTTTTTLVVQELQNQLLDLDLGLDIANLINADLSVDVPSNGDSDDEDDDSGSGSLISLDLVADLASLLGIDLSLNVLKRDGAQSAADWFAKLFLALDVEGLLDLDVGLKLIKGFTNFMGSRSSKRDLGNDVLDLISRVLSDLSEGVIDVAGALEEIGEIVRSLSLAKRDLLPQDAGLLDLVNPVLTLVSRGAIGAQDAIVRIRSLRDSANLPVAKRAGLSGLGSVLDAVGDLLRGVLSGDAVSDLLNGLLSAGT
ncbi:unnamed protein product [Parascedosporium putredinis]|uniref:Uncharacterized protein n=1 Tax=Parascedosporium putredinis TaxID=1442378 RepID=A0A9P1HA30_9PEZI|nr:unnamed protein product [Parascedosporium putredinis]CAI8000992.1 unnamed protein product [Parascedosporium putredinis]